MKTCVLSKGFAPESFLLKYNPPTFEYKIHFVEVDLYYFKYLEIKNQVFLIIFAHPSSDAKWTAESSELVRSLSLDMQILDPAI